MEEFIQVIKDYGAAIISFVSVGGVAAVAGIIIKVKQAIDGVKDKISAVTKERDDAVNEVKEVGKKYDALQSDMKVLISEMQDIKTQNFEKRK